jgi:hypothetical protein
VSDEILLDEVSPEGELRITAIGDSMRIRSKGGLLGDVDREIIFPLAARRALVETMIDVPDLCDDARAGSVGIRVNRLAIGDRTIRYLPSDIDDRIKPTPEVAKLRAARGTLLAIVKSLLEDVVGKA